MSAAVRLSDSDIGLIWTLLNLQIFGETLCGSEERLQQARLSKRFPSFEQVLSEQSCFKHGVLSDSLAC